MPFKQSVEPAACLNIKPATDVAAEDAYGSQQKTLCGKNNQRRVKLNMSLGKKLF